MTRVEYSMRIKILTRITRKTRIREKNLNRTDKEYIFLNPRFPRNPRQKIISVCLLLFISLCFSPLRVEAIPASDVSEGLVKLGMEDVRVGEEGGILRVAYEDNVYRGTYRGLAAVVRMLSADSSVNSAVHIVVLENRIPQISVRLPEEAIVSYREGISGWKELVGSLRISYATDEDMKMLGRVKAENRSAGKVDFVLYPQVSLNNSWLDKLYGTVLSVAPAVEVGLWKGASFTGQVVFPVWNNMGGEYDYIRAGMLVFRQEYRFPHNLFASFSIGNFNANRIGANVSLLYRPDNDRWAVGVDGGVTGSSTFYGGKWEVSMWNRVNGSVLLRYNEPRYHLEFDLRGSRYVFGDYGVRLDCTRHFGEVSVGLYAMYTGGKTNGGFHFAIPLPRRKRGKHRAFRIRLPEYFDWEYQAQTGSYYTRHLGWTYETRPDENHSRNYYNPEFIKAKLMTVDR